MLETTAISTKIMSYVITQKLQDLKKFVAKYNLQTQAHDNNGSE